MLQLDYTATTAHLDLLDVHQATLEDLAVGSAQWDPMLGPAPAGLEGAADLVLCNHASGPLCTDPEVLMTNLASGAKKGGFVLLHTLLKGETLAETISFLSSTTNSKSQTGLLTQVRIHTVVTSVIEYSFFVVSFAGLLLHS